MNMRRPPAALAVSAAVDKDVDRIRYIWAEALQRSGGPFLFGEFTIADAMFAPVVSRFEVYRLGDSDEVRRYSASMTALDAWQEWISAARDEPWTVESVDFDPRRTMNPLKLEDCINELCPWSGEPVSSDSLTRYRGQVVGFCNPGCREKFDKAVRSFDDLLTAHSPVSEPYCKREFIRLDRWELAGHRLKVYGISVPGNGGRLAELGEAAREYAERSLLPAANDAGSSSGLGYAILHVGEPGTWLLVHWWAHQNVVCQRLALAPHDAADFDSMDDRPFHACVWEQVVIQRERDGWVRHMMSSEPDADRYLEDWLPDGSY